ncbi:MAG: tRNA uracil 4-sulfurtransferase ThiI [Bacilli bacterium]|jgi:thiamine biosynthesis protein ThiI|nr:tRNA uracil 4-sulfurtransferase ThiI [Bacillota bacterium]
MVMIHFGELYTKGKNRRDFIRQLTQNIKEVSAPFKVHIETRHDHIYIKNIQENNLQEIIKRLQNVSGIHAISEVVEFPLDLEKVKQFVLSLVLELKPKTFKVITKRKDKLFPLRSDEVNRSIASHILKNAEIKVDVHDPELPLRLEIDTNRILVVGKRYDGLGGYPLGAAGKGLVLLSGGIDSPVAAYLMIRRGIKIAAIHFAAPPYTSEEVLKKIENIVAKLNNYQPCIRLYVVPFTNLQLAIYEHSTGGYAITLMRRMMLRISTIIAKRHGYKVLVTGDSLGQVSSQTLESLVVINEVTNYPIIRPLATVDKNEIIKIAKGIQTYPISILPYEDCCTIFPVTNSVTSPKLEDALRFESKFDYESLISEAISDTKKVDISLNNSEDELF